MYDFHDLSPLDFEDLVRELLQEELRVRLEAFGPGRDNGIDCRFSQGPNVTIVQAKHFIRSGKNKLLAALKEEDAKVRQLQPTRYIIATSVSMTPSFKNKIISSMPNTPLAAEDIFGAEDINNLLTKFPDIEKNNFKLWLSSTPVLERIMHSGIYNRTDTELDIIKKMIPKFVQNNSVKESERILNESGTLIISGHPGVGKTTLARMVIWLHAAQDWKIFVVDDISEAFEISNPGEKRLIFFDDFLGQVQLSPDHVRGMDQRLPPFLERVKANKNLRFILTTRTYILSQAEMLSRRLASRELSSNKYVLNVGVYTRTVRAKILFNHIYFSGLTEYQISEILEDDFYIKVIDHKNFNPRLIELLTNEEYASLSGDNLRQAIERILANPNELWERPYRDHISADSRALMLSLLFFQNLAHFSALRSAFTRISEALGAPVPDAQLQPRFSKALKELEGSVIAILNQTVQFSNPGVRDFLLAVVATDNLLPSLVSKTRNFGELYQCWGIFRRNAQAAPFPTEAAIWIAAVERMEFADEGEQLDRLELVLDLYAQFRESPLLDFAMEIADRIDEDGFDGTQVRRVGSALENVKLYTLPFDEENHIHSIITNAAARLLVDYAAEMPFEDLSALDESLFNYGFDISVAENAIHAALDAFIPEIDNEMADFGSIDELDEFADNLKELIKKRGYFGKSPDKDLNYKRDKLQEDEYERDDDRGYRSASRPSAPKDVSDDYIRSMFRGLGQSRTDS